MHLGALLRSPVRKVFWSSLNGVASCVGEAQEMVTMGYVWWITAAGVAVPLVLAFLAGNAVETYRARRLLSRLAKERRDLENQRRELEAGWDELDAGWDALEAEQADTDRRRHAFQV